MTLWAGLASDYYDVLELSKRSAAKLVAGIKDTDALITELDSLIVSMAQQDFNRRSALEDLITRAESLNTEQQRIVEARHTAVTREVEEAEINVNAYQRQLQGLQDRHIASSLCIINTAEAEIRSYISDILQSLPRDPAEGWGNPHEQGGPGENAHTRRGTLDAEQVSAITDERRILEEEIWQLENALADAQIQHAGAQTCLQVFQSAGWESTRNAMCMVVVYLKTYAEHIGVFAELQKQLWHEVDIYKHALEGVKMFSTSVRRNALQEMQQRVSSTACAWEGAAALIMNEYVK
ncbi:uncharacterized protein TRAVEDRAFT_50829 [Trametes versicolor FP-101664 SS1]|uniref:uncharacterized protein n=1 Tax=Trametes versicolor (strain FP-101664) TaxID=717944 RepID=UPI000462338F|nr:uncharacterized protein TRAVEDRAFT_50829 [Trametes versicolor FP-101664 SS1]EIW54689.1 hypothetical protein TRAVEDRAFT_50829 [Trametes versicolor FP-101664 SS1]